MQYYKSTITKKIVSGNFAKSLDYIYGKGTVERLLAEGTLSEVIEPSIEECIRHGGGSLAVVRYREIYPELSWAEASSKVEAIKKAMNEGKSRKR